MPNSPTTMLPRTRKWLLRSAAVLALGAVFVAYLQPGFVVDVANRVWSCF